MLPSWGLRCWSRSGGGGPEGRRDGDVKADGGRKGAMRAGRKEEERQVTAAGWSGPRNHDFCLTILAALRSDLRASLLFPHIKSEC